MTSIPFFFNRHSQYLTQLFLSHSITERELIKLSIWAYNPFTRTPKSDFTLYSLPHTQDKGSSRPEKELSPEVQARISYITAADKMI